VSPLFRIFAIGWLVILAAVVAASYVTRDACPVECRP
jgi:hypothetical protein